jgi:hypothetical protein
VKPWDNRLHGVFVSSNGHKNAVTPQGGLFATPSRFDLSGVTRNRFGVRCYWCGLFLSDFAKVFGEFDPGHGGHVVQRRQAFDQP